MQTARKLYVCVAKSLLLCALTAFASRSSVAQTTDSTSQLAPQASPQTATSDVSSSASAEAIQPNLKGPALCSPSHFVQCFRDIAHDQAGIWSSPLHLHSRDAFWLVPFVGATALAFHYDAQAQQQLSSSDGTRMDISTNISRFGSTYATIGAGGSLYFLGRFTHNDHLAETGRLGVEAVIDTALVSGALKAATNRQRPLEGNGAGGFWPHGTQTLSDSFPSGHAMQSWALARVIAAEYPNKLTQLGAYSFAAAISLSRVTSKKHFPSDVLVGSVFGYLIGGYVVRHHAGRQLSPGFSFAPIVDASTHTYGARLDLTPADLHHFFTHLTPN